MQLAATKSVPWISIWFSLAIAAFLEIIKLPDTVTPYWPQWLVLVLVFWSVYLPRAMTIALAWLVGLLLDIVQFGLLGQNAFSKTLLVYVARLLQAKMRSYFIWQQMIVIFILCVLDTALGLLIHGMQGPLELQWWMWSPCLVSMFCWFPLRLILHKCIGSQRG